MHELRERFFGQSIEEVVDGYLGELRIDAVVLIGIISTGRDGFSFKGEALIGFVRRCLTAMMEHGAKPVVGGDGTRYYWIEQPQYGSSTREIVDNVIAEWLANGDPNHGGLWFAKPHLF